jgi:glucose-1-phosphate thymidylyltransferase
MIYDLLSTLMLAGIREILIITRPDDLPMFRSLFGDGSPWGVNLDDAEQPNPEGIAQAFLVGKSFLGDTPCCLVLGEHSFYGHGLVNQLKEAGARERVATIFGYFVSDPQALWCRRARCGRACRWSRRETAAYQVRLSGDRHLFL